MYVSVYIIEYQLKAKVYKNEYMYFERQLKSSFYFFITCILSIMFSSFCWWNMAFGNGKTDRFFFFVIMELLTSTCVTCFLTATLFFVVVDVKICHALVEKLISETEADTITVDKFNNIRNKIERRIEKTATINTLRILVVMLNLIVIIIFIFIGNYFAFEIILYCVAASFKEMLFVTVIFLQVAKVNESADKLTRLLGNTAFIRDNHGRIDDKGLTRMAICNDLLTRPIAVTLAGRRLTLRDTVIHMSAIVIMTVVGIFRSLILTKIE